MAITKTYIYNTSRTETMRNLYNWLLENAVGKYFDRVVFDDTLTYSPVDCYIGDAPFISFRGKNPSWTYNMFSLAVATSAGTVIESDSKEGELLQYVHACENGFFLTTSSYEMAVCVTRDNNGKPCIFWQGGFAPPTESEPVELWTMGVNTGAAVGRSFCKPVASDLTCLTPIPLCDCGGAYAPNAFLMPFAQYREPGVLDINGIKYLSNGLWCIKD